MRNITINLQIEDGLVKGMWIVNELHEKKECCNPETDGGMDIYAALWEIEEYAKDM